MEAGGGKVADNRRPSLLIDLDSINASNAQRFPFSKCISVDVVLVSNAGPKLGT